MKTVKDCVKTLFDNSEEYEIIHRFALQEFNNEFSSKIDRKTKYSFLGFEIVNAQTIRVKYSFGGLMWHDEDSFLVTIE
jgi:flagellar assembly factor FliW